jgi:hypothetical protein
MVLKGNSVLVQWEQQQQRRTAHVSLSPQLMTGISMHQGAWLIIMRNLSTGY